MDYKFARFKTRDFIILALLAAVVLLVELIISVGTGTLPVVIFALFVDPIFAILAVFIVRKFGVVILGALLAGTLALPTPAFGVVPGLAKYILLVSAAILMELVILIFQKRERLASLIGGGALVVGNSLSFYCTALFLGIPSIQDTMLVTITIVGFFVGVVGGYIGYLIYRKIENKSFIKQLQS